METSFPNRIFQVWEYSVSHGSLLIRSPKGNDHHNTIDLLFSAVRYMALPYLLKGIELVEATSSEIEQLSLLLETPIKSGQLQIVLSNGNRFPIVAGAFRTSVSELDYFETPFPEKLRPKFAAERT
jgi:hypothetical protein